MTLLIDGDVRGHYTHKTYRLTRIHVAAVALVPHTATVTSLTAPPVSPPRRPGTVYLAVMASLVLAWLAALLLWHGDPSTDRALHAGLTYLVPLALLAVGQARYLWLFSRPRPVALDVRDGSFVAPAHDRLLSAFAVSGATGVTVPSASLLRPTFRDVPQWILDSGRVGVVFAVAGFLLILSTFVRGAGRIELRSDGLRLTYAYGSRDVPWDAVAAGPPRRATLWEPVLRIGRPDLVRSTGLALRRPRRAFLPASWSRVRREFLVDAVNYYLATPAARHTIGTADGYVHLRRVLGAGTDG